MENEVVDIPLSEKIRITKKQYEVLKIVCDTYQKSMPKYIQEALVEVLRSDIEEGNFCDALLDKLGGEDREEEKGMNSSPPVVAVTPSVYANGRSAPFHFHILIAVPSGEALT
jgi:hypothetical protein